LDDGNGAARAETEVQERRKVLILCMTLPKIERDTGAQAFSAKKRKDAVMRTKTRLRG
jgi:hypothetical protein